MIKRFWITDDAQRYSGVYMKETVPGMMVNTFKTQIEMIEEMMNKEAIASFVSMANTPEIRTMMEKVFEKELERIVLPNPVEFIKIRISTKGTDDENGK